MSSYEEARESLLQKIAEIKNRMDSKAAKRYNFEQTERIVNRLAAFSDECEECKKHFHELEAWIEKYREQGAASEKEGVKEYLTLISNITAHFQKSHKLVTEGYYTSVYLSLGVALGLPFGLVIAQLLHNMAFMGVGMPIGIAIGAAFGSSMDAQAKKNGLVI